MKDSFLKSGDFFATSGVPKLKPFEMAPSIYPLFNFIFWQFSTLVPISYYLVKLLFSGELLYFSIGMSIIGACKYSNKHNFMVTILLKEEEGIYVTIFHKSACS